MPTFKFYKNGKKVRYKKENTHFFSLKIDPFLVVSGNVLHVHRRCVTWEFSISLINHLSEGICQFKAAPVVSLRNCRTFSVLVGYKLERYLTNRIASISELNQT